MATALYPAAGIVDFVISEAELFRSRDNITVTQTGAAVASGTLLAATVTPGLYVPYTPGGADDAVAVLYTPLKAATGAKKAVAYTSDCEISRTRLTGLDAAAEASLRTHGIKVRGTASLPTVSTPAL